MQWVCGRLALKLSCAPQHTSPVKLALGLRLRGMLLSRVQVLGFMPCCSGAALVIAYKPYLSG